MKRKLNWRPFPYLRIVMAFILGIVFYDFSGFQFSSTVVLLSYLLFLAFTLLVYYYTNKNLLISISLLLTVMLAGVSIQHFSNTKIKNDLLWSSYNKIENLEGIVEEVPILRNRIRTTIQLSRGYHKEHEFELCGKLLVYFSGEDSIALSYKPGDLINFSTVIREIDGTSNPHAFDYEAYLRNRRIDFQSFIKPHAHHLISTSNQSLLANLSFSLREKSLEVFSQYLSGRNLAVANAMILGYKNLLDDELYSAYTESGAVHVLAVSGLHVGIIAYLFILLFSKIPDYNLFVKGFKTFVLIFIVVFFAFMTGSAPAVVRAAIMFSLFIIAKYWLPNYNIYNILAISAIFMLLYEPNVLYQASFQFSYLALTSIVFFQPILSKLWTSKHKSINYILGLAIVAISAQILVFPVTIFYFHKFPLYFILSGIIAIPSALFILPLGLALLIMEFLNLPFLASLTAILLNYVLDFLNFIIVNIQKLPYASLEGIWIDWLQMLFLYLGLLFILLRFITFGKRNTVISAIFFLSFTLLSGYRLIEKQDQLSLTIYDLYNGYLIDLTDGDDVVYWKSENVDNKSLKFVAKNNRDNNNISSIHEISDSVRILTSHTSCDFQKIEISDETFYLINRQNIYEIKWKNEDRLILLENIYENHIDLFVTQPFKELIIPRTVSFGSLKIIEQKINANNLKVVAKEGALVFNY